jgi:serine/threonine-protein kinase HipA
MPRHRLNKPLRVLLNNRLVGRLLKQASGAISFQYDESWLSWSHTFPISMSLPLREDAFRGDRVVAVCENLLPDSESLRRRVAERVGAQGTDAYSLLSQIGRDCVGALQFVPDDEDTVYDTSGIKGEVISEEGIEKLLKNLARAPLGLDNDREFRISVAGAQEKTALLHYKGKWWKPHGTTPTTHILKTQIGTLQNGIDLSNSVENEYYCLKLMAAFGLPANAAEITVFGDTAALVIERFDRKWASSERLLRVPQEDFCQALSCPPSLKYQSQGGPGIVDGLNLLKGSDTPAEDQKAFLKAQVLYWLIGATDGHAKNFSIFLGRGGRFKLTPVYDVLTAQPSLASRQIERKQLKLAMSVGDNRHYRIDEIKGRHFIQSAERAGLPGSLASDVLTEVAQAAETAIKTVEKHLPRGFPAYIHDSVKASLTARLKNI